MEKRIRTRRAYGKNVSVREWKKLSYLIGCRLAAVLANLKGFRELHRLQVASQMESAPARSRNAWGMHAQSA
jgi:hypothetical protein